MNNNDSREKYIKYQMMNQQMMQLQRQLEELTAQKEELNFIISSLKEFQSSKGEKELLAPISPGIFVKAKVEEYDSFLVHVGNGVVVNKSTDEAIKLVEKQIVEFEKFIEELNNKLLFFDKEFVKLSEELKSQNV
ncbi:prefoldin subunit alpha [Candidatus Woesearchaeota archaeon]|nr:prefoldin subunit alpha [Candidatus Woesearchaeota archaeon]